MPAIPKPTLDDQCASMARFLHCLERADPDVLEDLIARVAVGPNALRQDRQCLMGLIQEHMQRKLRRTSRENLTMARKSIANRQKLTRRNPVARLLPQFAQRIVRSRTKYSRKGCHAQRERQGGRCAGQEAKVRNRPLPPGTPPVSTPLHGGSAGQRSVS